MICCPCCATKIEGVALPDDQLHKLRDGEVVLYKRPESSRWQARFKLPDGKWHHISTKRANLDEAKRIAGDAYDHARFRHRDGIAPVSRRFRDVARLAIIDMDDAREAGRGKVAYKDYRLLLEKYFIPYFGSKHIDKIAQADISEFDAWRLKQMGKAPAASTLLNHNAAMKKVFEKAIANGWVVAANVPELKSKGKKAERRPDFTHADWQKLTRHARHWIAKSGNDKSLQIRELLWDYVMILTKTGMRTGREAMNLKWGQIRWATNSKDGEKFLLIAVDGKTGKRDLVARSGCEEYFMRIQQRFPDLAKLSFDDLLKAKRDEYVFRMRNGKRPHEMCHAFEDLLEYAGVLYDAHGEKRTLYSLRHTYATSRLMIDKVDIHTLAVQMGTSVGMIEKHYSHLTAAMAAGVLAGRRHDPDKASASRKSKKTVAAKLDDAEAS